MNPLATPGYNNLIVGNVGNSSTRSVYRGSEPLTRVKAAGAQTDRYNPSNEGLDRDWLLDDVIPKADAQLMSLFERIYQTDAVAGTAVDMLRTFAWSDYTLSGIKDPAKMKLFADALDMFNPIVTMPEIHGEFLKYGRSISTLVFSQELGTWTDIIPHNPAHCILEGIPIRGFDPRIDVTASTEMQRLLSSTDPRDKIARERIPKRLIDALKKGRAELDPLTTLFVPRRVSMTDWKGTSLFWRILPYYAIERALLSSTISNARRRTRSILHVQMGIDQVWEPTDAEMADATNLFLQSEEDPAGAVIVTRNGFNVGEVRAGSDHWKISDEQDQLRAAKLNGLGISEAILSGDANFNTMDATLTMFVEGQKVVRSHLTNQVIYRMLFAQIARAHGLLKSDRSQADASHNVRTGGRRVSAAPLSVDEALKIPFKDLEIPMVHWTKNLSPQSDQAYFDILEKAETKGVPIPVSMWASAAGIDLTQLVETLPDDAALRKKLKKYQPKPAEGGGFGGGGGGAFGSAANDGSRYYNAFTIDDLGINVLASFVGFDSDKRILGIAPQSINEIFNEITANHKAMEILTDWPALERFIAERTDNDQQVETVKYVLARAGYARCPVDTAYLLTIAEQFAAISKQNDISKQRLKLVRDELVIIAALYARSKELNEAISPAFYQLAQTRIKKDAASVAARAVLRQMQGVDDRVSGKYLYSGVTNA
jgi:hypothetical protein